MYLYPGQKDFDDELIDTIASGRRILPYLDIPFQHINDEVLRRMRRGVTREQTEQLIGRLRERIPGLTLRTTLMVGFPGETDAQFDELVDFVREQRFERLGTFAYRREPGTVSDTLDCHLSEDIKQKRLDILMEAQQQIAFELANAQVGKKLDAILDQPADEEATAFVGRTVADAPEVDAVVYVTGENLRPGQIVPCEIVATENYDLIGVAVDQPK